MLHWLKNLVTVLIPKSDQPEILSNREDLRGNLLQESMCKGDMNPVMYGILKLVEYKVQIITFSQIFQDFYTCLLGELCKIPKSFNGQRYRCGIYCAFEGHLLVHLQTSHRSTSSIVNGGTSTFSISMAPLAL